MECRGYEFCKCRAAALPHCRAFLSIDGFLLKNLLISKILIIFAFKYWHICNELCQE